MKRRRPRPSIVCLPPAITKQPIQCGLSVFELATAAAILTHARPHIVPHRRAYAWKAGAKRMGKVRAIYKNGSRGEKEEYFYNLYNNLGQIDHDFRARGRSGNRSAYHRYDHAKHGDIITITVSRRALLRIAGMSLNSRNRDHLTDALTRLTQPVLDLPPLLAGLTVKAGQLVLSINPEWLARQTATVPLPLPIRGRGGGMTVVALCLFAYGAIDHRPDSGRTMDVEKLCRRIGIKFRYRAEAHERLRAAFKRLNSYLEDLRAQLIEESLPVAFEPRPVRRDEARIRIAAIKVPVKVPEAEEVEVEAMEEIKMEEPVKQKKPDRTVLKGDARAELRRWNALTLEQQEEEIKSKATLPVEPPPEEQDAEQDAESAWLAKVEAEKKALTAAWFKQRKLARFRQMPPADVGLIFVEPEDEMEMEEEQS